MSISTKLSDIRTAISSAYTAVSNMGGTVPALPTLNALPSAIQTIPTGASVTALSVSENGTYTASSGYAYSPVTVNVPTGGGDIEQYQKVLDRTIVSFSDSTLTRVGSSAFNSCYSLTSVNLPNCSYVDGYAFYNCSSLTAVNMPSCTYVGPLGFGYCRSGILSINFPVCSIVSTQAFQYCSSLITVNLPICTSIGNNAFDCCYKLSSINIPSCTSIGNYAFRSCASLSAINLPNCLSIGSYAFSQCRNLTSVSVPVLTYLASSALAYCRLYSISLPVCSFIGSSAFYYCDLLNTIYIGSSKCSLAQSAVFSRTSIWSDKGSIFVKRAYYNYYKTSTNWAFFSNRIFSY